MAGGSKVHRSGVARTAKEAAKRHKRPCRSAPAVPSGLAVVYKRKHVRHQVLWNARATWNALTLDVASRPLTPKRYQVQLRATDASGEAVETHGQAVSAKANGAAFTVHAGSAPVAKYARELDAGADVIKKTLTGVTTGIPVQVDFYARKKTSSDVTLVCYVYDTTSSSVVATKNGGPDSTTKPHVIATVAFTPVAAHNYEARWSYVSGAGTGLADQVQWHDQGNAAVWTQIVAGDDLAVSFPDLPRPGSWYFQVRMRAESIHQGAKCWGLWTSWTTATQPATGTPTGPDTPDNITLVCDRVEGTYRHPWRARVGWNEVSTWIPEDGDPEDGVARYDVQLAVSNDAGATTANTRRVSVPADPTDTTSHADFFNAKGKRHYRARVRAFDQIGNPGAWSSWTSWVSPGGAPNAVTTVTWSNPTPGTLLAKWDRPTDPTDIDLYHVKVLRGTTVVDDGFTAGNRWTYHIPVADRGSTHKVRVSTTEEDLILDVDDSAPTGYVAGDESTTLDSALLANSDLWLASSLDLTGAGVDALSDNVAPASSPAANVTGGPGYLAVRWDAITNADPVTYEVHVSVSTGFTPSAGTLVAETKGTLAFIRLDGSDVQLVYGTPYFVKIIAKDADGAAAAGTQGSASLVPAGGQDLAVDGIVADHIVSGSLTADKLAATLLLVNALKTADTGQRVELTPDGLAMYDSTGAQLVSIPTHGDPYFRATIEALGLDVLGKFTLRGVDNIIEAGATITLRDKTANPAAAPVVSAEWDHLSLSDKSEKVGLHYDPSGTGSVPTFITSSQRGGRFYLQEYTVSTGVLAREVALDPEVSQVHGVARLSTNVYALLQRGSRYYVQRHLQSNLSYAAILEVTGITSSVPGFGVFDGTHVGVFVINGSGDVEVHKIDSSLAVTGPTTIGAASYDYNSRVRGAVKVTESAVDYWFVSVQASASTPAKVVAFKVSDTLETATRSFLTESFSGRGIAHNGTRFYTVGAGSGSLTIHSNWIPTSTDTLYVRYAYETTGGLTTVKSPVATYFGVRQRAYTRVTTPDIPSGLNKVAVYAGVHASSEPTMYQQTLTTSKTGRLPETLVVSGTTAPTTATVGAGTAAVFESEDGSPLLRADGYSRAKIKNGSGDTLTTATETTLTLVSSDADTDSYWNGSNNYVVVPFTGQYEVVAQVSFAANGTGKRYLKLQTSSTPGTGASYADYAPSGDGFASALPVSGDRQTVLIATLVTLTAGDGIRMRGYQNSGGNLAVTNRITLMFQGPN